MFRVRPSDSTITISVQPSQDILTTPVINMHDSTDYLSAGVAKDWAVKLNEKVCGEDYSAKYYASLAKTSEMSAKQYRDEAIQAVTDRVLTATADRLGGIKVGENLQITDDGTLSRTLNAQWGLVQGEISNQTDLINKFQEKMNINLDNMNVQAVDVVNQIKAIETGSVSETPRVLNWIKQIQSSTFDSSMFSVVGSPTITKDGIASGFSQYDYLAVGTGINYDIANHTYTFKGRIILSNLSNGSSYCFDLFGMKYLIILNHTTSSGTISLQMLNASDSNVTAFTTDSFSLSLNDYIDFKLNLSSTKQEIFYSVNGGAVSSKDSTISPQLTTVSNAPFYIGAIGSASWYVSTQATDLKYVALEEDGVEVFSGNKTGIDTIKPDNYTVVGTPTISTDGIASGFNYSSACLATTFKPLTNTWKIKIKVRPSSVSEQYNAILGGDNGYIKPHFFFQYNKLSVFLSSTGSSWDIAEQTTGTHTYNANTDYYLILEYTGTQYIASYSIDDINYIQDIVINNSSSIYNSSNDTLLIGAMFNGAQFSGSIDLNSFKIYVDGNLVYQPCLKIPYTLSKTGSKIADSVYRDRVIDMYNQFGYAPYYTLSDTDFTLPQGEVYGMIERNLNVDYPTQKEKDTITSWVMPDYANGISVSTSPYTAPSAGYFYGVSSFGTEIISQIYINNVIAAYAYSGTGQSQSSAFVPVSKGDIVTITNMADCIFFPMKGAN